MRRSTLPPQQLTRLGPETRWSGPTAGWTAASGWTPSGAAGTATCPMSRTRAARGERRPLCPTRAPGGEAWALRWGWRRPAQKAPAALALRFQSAWRATVRVNQTPIIKHRKLYQDKQWIWQLLLFFFMWPLYLHGDNPCVISFLLQYYWGSRFSFLGFYVDSFHLLYILLGLCVTDKHKIF